jgi:DNA-binding response OmpR family regulator
MTTPDERSATERPHVLIVSDDEDLAGFLAEGLLYGGFWTSVVASGIQTLEVFRLRAFDLVVLDAALTAMPAAEVVRRLRGSGPDDTGPRTDVPILVVAGNAREAAEIPAWHAAIDGIVAPPIELEELAPRLHGVVAGWRAAHPGRPFADQASAARPEEPEDPNAAR